MLVESDFLQDIKCLKNLKFINLGFYNFYLQRLNKAHSFTKKTARIKYNYDSKMI
jgi:hypothetical protein